MNIKPFLLAMALGLSAPLSVIAADDPARLGKDLTPSGAEITGSKDGQIPVWTGKEDPLPGWQYGKVRGDYWKHKSDKPVLTIDASNMAKYADKLSPGQVSVLETVKGFKMEVYQSHRSCSVPDFVVNNTRKNVEVAKMAEDGWALKEAMVPGYPFPFAKTGAQAMWNSKFRYRGIGTEYRALQLAVSPRKGSDTWILAGNEATFYMPWAEKGSRLLSSLPQVEVFGYNLFTSPTALAGQAFTITAFTDKPSETFMYFPGQRRVRRMPTYAYDAPMIGFENQYLMDELNVFYGTLDRFDWKLVGKKEMYVPYNSFGAFRTDIKLSDALKPEALDAALRRYELHRVWVVEASIKSGMRHSFPKRTFYLDEDSWNLVLGEDYDGQGKIAKVREGYTIPVYETGSCDSLAMTEYNLNEGRYVFDAHSIGSGAADIKYVVEGTDSRYKASFYTSENLRTISDR